MNSGWVTRKLSDVLEVQNGYAFDSERFSSTGGVPLIRIRSLKAGIESQTFFSGEYDAKYLVDTGDLLIGMDGEFGCYQWIGGKALLNQRVCRLQKFATEITPRFLFYGVNSYLKAIEDVTGYTTVKHISSKQILDIDFPVPPLPEQQRIVAILDEVFAGITAARANAEQNLKNARELFESNLHSDFSEKAFLGDLVDIKTGKLDANAAVENGKYPFFTCSRSIYAIDDFAFDCEAILLAGNNAVGDFNVKHYKGKFNAYQRTYVITVNANARVLYRFLYFQILKSLKRFKEQSVGAGTKFLKIGMIKELEISLPGLDEQQRIVSRMDSIKEETQRLESIYQQKIAALDELKKALLHKAFSGELSNNKSNGDAA
ncbi:restriction endonuclease subunit S [Pseudomonas sp.]|uniref:restriction endonuclease subunit S n=1 Tax=Pseudomonas sp. TaxID=306 RepID=UPI0027318B04|nr:restriction endonuclease subunit S [Pseudomonas sp.]MDP2244823.1 restriction endonuclease subunit S [Pseudomonas sp.]